MGRDSEIKNKSQSRHQKSLQKRINMGDRDEGVKLFVYGVSSSCPKDLLESEFGKCGRVNDIFNSGKGFVFITMADERDAKIACEDLNGTTLDGQKIKVEISHGKGSDRRRDDRRDGGRDRRDGGYGGRGRSFGRGRDRGGFGDRRSGGFGGGRRDDRDRRGGGYGGGGRDDRSRDRDRSYNRRDDRRNDY